MVMKGTPTYDTITVECVRAQGKRSEGKSNHPCVITASLAAPACRCRNTQQRDQEGQPPVWRMDVAILFGWPVGPVACAIGHNALLLREREDGGFLEPNLQRLAEKVGLFGIVGGQIADLIHDLV